MNLMPIEYRVLGWVAAILVVAGIIWGILVWRDNNAATERSAEQGVRTDQAASGISQDAGVISGVIGRAETTAAEARNDYQRGYEDAKRDNPVVRDWASQPVPQRLRDLARERRLARERLGCAGDGCPDDDEAQR